jgi:hypothetical protein
MLYPCFQEATTAGLAMQGKGGLKRRGKRGVYGLSGVPRMTRVKTALVSLRKELAMASNDIRPAQKTYAGFISMFKYGTIACALIVAFVVFLLAR